MLRRRCCCSLRWLLAVAFVCAGAALYGVQAQDGTVKPKLKRSDGKRWARLNEIAKAEIKSATQKFLEERNHALTMPLEVDVLLVGFDGDGGYGYRFAAAELEELLGSSTADGLCPVAWDTHEPSAVCYNVNFVMLDLEPEKEGIKKVEKAIQQSLEHVGDRSQDWSDGSKAVQVYEVEATDLLEPVLWELLEQAYGPEQPQYAEMSRHNVIIVINPNKLRMSPANSPASANTAAAAEIRDFVAEWKKGQISQTSIVDQEGAYVYRYKYQGAGASASWMSQYNFLVIDVSAGPVSFGPLASPAGSVTPTGMPRLMPLLLRMAREVESTPEVGTLRTHLLENAAKGQKALFLGQLAQTVAASVRHVFAPDVVTEHLPHAYKRLLVPVIVLQDHAVELNQHQHLEINVDNIQLALDEMLPAYQTAAVTISHHTLRSHPALATAIAKARHTKSAAVLSEPPDQGLHMHESLVIGAADLVRELKLSQDSLMAALDMEDLSHRSSDYDSPSGSEEEEEEEGLWENQEHDTLHADPSVLPPAVPPKRAGTRVLPVFVLSLQRLPYSAIFDNGHQVVATPDMIVVLQLLSQTPPHDLNQEAEAEQTHPYDATVYSGHMQEGNHLAVSTAHNPTRHIVAGLLTSVAGVVPPYQRWCMDDGGVVEDWRWGVGAVPWGPYSNFAGASTLLASAARRNLVVARIEGILRKLQARMDTLDTFIAKHLQGPFAYLSVSERVSTESSHVTMMPGHHLLDDLAMRSFSYASNKTKKGSAKKGKVDHDDGTADEHEEQDAGGHAMHHGGGWMHDDGGLWHHDDDVERLAAHEAKQADKKKKQAKADTVILPSSSPSLTPDVVARMQTKLTAVAHAIEQISYVLYNKDWDHVDGLVDRLGSEVDQFLGEALMDMVAGQEVLQCCQVVHDSHEFVNDLWFGIAVFIVLLGGMGVVSLVMIKAKAMLTGAKRPKRPSHSGAGLPQWGVGPGGMLPRYNV